MSTALEILQMFCIVAMMFRLRWQRQTIDAIADRMDLMASNYYPLEEE